MDTDTIDRVRDESAACIVELSKHLSNGLVGISNLIERLLIGMLSGGHLLVEGAPGLAKTRAVKLLSEGLDASFSRIQCTPDLMPSDLTGTPVFRPNTGKFEFVEGPLFNSLVLVDEINRAPPKVQSAMLEAMAENQITVGGNTYKLPDPFMVVATQNPIEHEGTFPLPEAQLDRFLLHVVLGLPEADAERQILDLVEREIHGAVISEISKLSMGTISQARAMARKTHLSPALKDYIVRIVTATRDPSIVPDIHKLIEHPISPRGTLALAACARARAYMMGRDYAIPEDVAELATDALAHRIVLTWRAAADGQNARDLMGKLLDQVQPL